MLKSSDGQYLHGARIRELPLSLANQIAAGEVVERPASVAKELVENSLDAGAQWIDLDVEQGGVRLIRVRDNGGGIYRDDLVRALYRHATSKISSLAELEQVMSLGFRGEALPSIASVSRLELSSRCGSDDHGWRVAADGQGGITAPMPVAHPFGTTVEVRELFFNTPARRKFLRSERTEQRHLHQVVKRTALSRFDVGFHLYCDGVSMLRLPPAHTERARSQRLAKICGTAFTQHALQIEFEIAGLRVMGWITDSGFSRGTADLQHLFVNGRWVRDSSATHAVRQAYQERIARDRYPAYVLYIDIDPRAIDVNVHPTKHEIRFRDSRLVHDFLLSSLTRALAEAAAETTYAMVSAQLPTPRNGDSSALGECRPPPTGIDAADTRSRWVPYGQSDSRSPLSGGASARDSGVRSAQPPPPLGHALGALKAEPYLLAENAQGLVLVDLRQALGRVIHWQLRQAYQGSCIQARPLLMPVSLSGTPDEMNVIESLQTTLKTLGFDLRCLGPETFSVRQIPSLVQGADIGDLVHDVLARLKASHETGAGSCNIGAILQAIATHGAAGSVLPRTLPEMNALLREMEAAGVAAKRNSSRPCWVQLSINEIKRLFSRHRVPGAHNNLGSGF